VTCGQHTGTAREPVRSATLGESDGPLARSHDLALLDLDGVVYIGPDPVPGATEALAAARAVGMRLAFVTNNASRTPSTVSEHLVRLGIPATPDEVVTSAMAAAALLARRLGVGERVLVAGGEGLHRALEDRGLVPVRSMAERPAAVVQGFGPRVGRRELTEVVAAVRAGLPWIATNRDPTVPTPTGRSPGNGALVARVVAATGEQPQVAGKPQPTLFTEAVQRYRSRSPLVVGDRLDTDLEGARAAGMPGLLVLTGVTDVPELLAAAPGFRPTFVGRDLGALHESHPRPLLAGGDGARLVRCREAEVAMTRGELRIVRPGAPLDLLRAACVACWTRADEQATAAPDPTDPKDPTAPDLPRGAEVVVAALATLDQRRPRSR